MIRNYRVTSFRGALMACVLIVGLSVLCLSDAKSDDIKASDPKKSVVISADNDGTSVQTSEKYRDDVRFANFPAQKGLEMTPDEATELEKALEKNPDDLNTAAQLLGFYNNARGKNPDARKKREKLILSLIQSHPDAAILGTYYGLLFRNDNCIEAQELWAKQVEENPKSIPILMNAAHPFLIYPPQELQPDGGLAVKYLLQAQAIEPDSPIINEKLAQVYMISRRFPGADKKDLAAKELAELTKVYKNSDNEAQKSMMLPQMAKASLEIPEELDSADKQADLMISNAQVALKNWPPAPGGTVWSGGRMISPDTVFLFYFGYFTKGMVALKKGDTDKAVEFLLKSAEAYKSQNALANGPNMSLAKALLEAGQKDAVIEFLGKCSKFWKNDQGITGKWTAEIKAGKIPDFGRSLYY